MTYQPPRIVKFQYPLRNRAWGFPQGSEKRRVDPWVLICIHITGNSRTAAMPVGIGPGSGTRAEVAYMARDRHFGTDRADYGNSAHDYIARDGSVLACIPTRIAAWNNGRILRPNTKLDSIKRILREVDRGRNANEAYVREVECTGSPGKWPLTKAQRETVAYLIARDSLKWDLPINRETVHAHADIDSVNRAGCPFPPAVREEQLERIILRAREIKRELRDPEPEPEPEPEPDPCADCQEALEAARGDVEQYAADLDAARARIAELEAQQPADCSAQEAAISQLQQDIVALAAQRDECRTALDAETDRAVRAEAVIEAVKAALAA